MYINKTYTALTTRRNFLNDFLNALESVSDKLVRVNDVIIIDNKYKFSFSFANDTTTELNIVFYVGDTLINSYTPTWCVNTNSKTTLIMRFAYAENDTCINFKLGDYRTNDTSFERDYLFVTTKSNIDRYGYTTKSAINAIDGNIYNKAGSSDTYAIQTRLAYVGGTSGVDIDATSSKILLSGTQKVDEISGMFDCSTVTANVVYPCNDGKQYYALNANTLMEV